MQYISLNGEWEFKDYYGEDWRWRDAHLPVHRDTRFWRRGTVPGSVHNDLWAVGEIPNPYFEQNSLLLEWIPARTWLYRKTFHIPEAVSGKRVQLRFEGVDYEAQFFLNGELLGEHTGMYTPAVFDVSERLHYGGENVLAVVIEPAPHEQPQVGRTSKVRTHKSRMTYWWDFCPRMVHIGIWEDVYLAVRDNVRIDDVFVRPQLSDDYQRADLAVSIELDAATPADVNVETIVRFACETIAVQSARHSLAAGQTHLDMRLALEAPRLWYPNGYGDQSLYELEVAVTPTGDAQPLNSRTVTFGIRRVGLVPNEDSDPTALPYTLVVNGRRVYAKGWNWVPIDVMYGVPRPEKLEHLLVLAQRANVNLLRIWGGGLIEREAFYDLADRLGIMVWQEFIQSSSGIDNYPPDSPDYITMMVREAEQIIPRKRNHPSLVIWCGGNELQDGPEQPSDDSHPLLAALKATVERLDPDRLWLPTSPSGRVFSNSLENIEADPTALHDVHGPWEFQGVTGQYELYNQGTSLLHSEFGVEGITNRKALDALIAPEHQSPVTLDNPLWQHLGAWWVKTRVWREVFGNIDDVETLRRATQYTQAAGLGYALEADRRRKYHNSGTLPWQFNEPYPMAACTSAVDYFGQAKPAYYTVARAYEPIHVSAKFPTAAWQGRDTFEAEVWVNNSHLQPYSDATLQAQVIGVDGRVYGAWDERLSIQPDSASLHLSLRLPLADIADDVFFLSLSLTDSGGNILSYNRYAFTRAANLVPLLNVASTTLSVEQAKSGDEWTLSIRNSGEKTAMFVWLEDSRSVNAPGYVYFGDNHLCLLPNETKQVSVVWRNVAPEKRALAVAGWNTNTLTVS